MLIAVVVETGKLLSVVVRTCSSLYVLQLQTIKAIINSRRSKSLRSDEPRRMQVLDLYCLARFESEVQAEEKSIKD